MKAYDQLDESMKRWVWKQGWQMLRPIQENSIEPILEANSDVLICAPTAGGKTEAAYLPILSNLVQNPIKEGFSVLNISPLKALINDQQDRLKTMAQEAGIEVTPWHGDIAVSSKKGALTRPSGILLITPESLEGMFAHKPHALEEAFRNLRYVVVDELHSFMGTERGVQLQSLLSRIERGIGKQIPRIALSATVADKNLATNFLRPGRGNYPVVTPSAGNMGHNTMVLVKEFIADGEKQFDEATAEDLFRNLRGSNNLVFANSRKEAEALAIKLKDLSEKEHVPNEFRLHHGSLSKTERHEAEKNLKEGALPTTAICTSTLELGVDIGKVKSIAQLGTANSVSSLRQRLGRSGRRGEPSVLRIYSLDEQRDHYLYNLRTGLVQNVAVVELLKAGKYEMPRASVPHYSTLIQQILSITSQFGSFYPADAWALLCRDGAFRNIPPEEFLTILKAMAAKDLLAPLGESQVAIGKAGERIVKSPDFTAAFLALKDLPVTDRSTGRMVGVVQYRPYVGEYILLAAQRWLVESVDDRTGAISVSPAHTTGKMMFEGFGQDVDSIIAQEMQEVYTSDEAYPYLDAASGAPSHLKIARDYYKSLELDPQGVGEVSISGENLLFTWGGIKLNRTLALMRRAEGQPMPAFTPYAVADVSIKHFEALKSARNESSILIDLASQVPHSTKMKEKYDYILPETLLNKKYAATALALPSQN